ncbi:MAG TPA: DUF6174 domain-containing protein [Pirellulales bacterium]|jgi:hypothetical protein
MNSKTNGQSPNGQQPHPKPVRASAMVLGAACGIGIVLAIIVVTLVLKRGPSVPEITRADLDVAEQKWKANGPAGYDMDITIGGRQPGVVHIEVRAGTVTKMTRDGVTPSQSRTWEYWTVPEQFETIRQDFDSSETAGGFGAAPGSQTILKAEFDSHYGYPRRYQRFVLGTDLAVEWDVTHFAPVE